MRRFYCPSADYIKGSSILLKDKKAHHIKNVLRLKLGDNIAVFDGKGKQYNCVIADMKSAEVAVNIISAEFSLSKESSFNAVLAQAIPNKPAKMNFVIEKATELGIGRIVPLSAHRSVVKLDKENAGQKRGKWQTIASEAAKQCGRTCVPCVDNVLTVKEAAALLADRELKLFFCIDKESVPLVQILKGISRPKTTAIFIGPEGDFTPEEIKTAKDRDFKIVSLGERVLRTETAPLYVLSVLDYLFG